MNKDLKHTGVMGMHWGHRKAQSGGDSQSNEPRKGVGGNIGPKSHQDLQKSLYNLQKRGKGNDMNAINKVAAKYDRDRAKEKTAKAIAKMANRQKEADDRRKIAKGDIEEGVAYMKERAAKRKEPFNEAKLRAQLEKTYASDLNATPESIHKERVKDGLVTTGIVLAGIGYLAYGNYLATH